MSYSNCVNIHGYCISSMYYFINFTRSFFSLSFLRVTSPLLIFFFFLKCTQTHPHTHTHPHRQINTKIHLLKKKKKKHRDIQTHPHTNKPKRTNNKETDQCLIGTWLERSELVGMGLAWSELGRSRSDLIWLDLIDACGWMLDRVLPDRSCGSVLVTEMVWIRPRGRVDLCSEMGREMGIEREQQIRKNG